MGKCREKMITWMTSGSCDKGTEVYQRGQGWRDIKDIEGYAVCDGVSQGPALVGHQLTGEGVTAQQAEAGSDPVCPNGEACRGVRLIFTGGHISLTVAFKGPNVILGLYKCNYSLTVK